MRTELPARRLQDPAAFGHVGLLVGGDSAEREVSLDGGRAIARAFDRLGVQYGVFDGARPLIEAILEGRVERVFNIMHGPGGEDGAIQGALQLLGTPVTGSGVLGSALTMDKSRSKWLMQGAGLPTADFEVLRTGDEPLARIRRLGWPLFVKPAGLGSSIGVSRVTGPGGLTAAVELARRYGDEVIVETAIVGKEYFAGILGATALPLIRIETPREFYDYEAKYHSDQTRYYCPCGLEPATERRLQEMSLQVFDLLHGSGWGRVDFIVDAAGQPWFLEVNTAPGMTDHSLVPQAAAVMGCDFDQLVWRILETSL